MLGTSVEGVYLPWATVADEAGSTVEVLHCWEGLIHRNIMENTMPSIAISASLEIGDIAMPYTLYWDTRL